MTRSKLIERIKASDHPDMLKAQIIAAVICNWPEGKNMPPITLDEIINFAAKVTGITSEDIKSKKRDSEYTRGRMLYCYYAYKNYPALYNLTKIGRAVNRDHTTVIHAVKTFESLLSIEDEIAVSDLDNIDDAVRTGSLNVFLPEPVAKAKKGPSTYALVYDRTDNIYFRTTRDAFLYLGLNNQGWEPLRGAGRGFRFVPAKVNREQYKEINIWQPQK